MPLMHMTSSSAHPSVVVDLRLHGSPAAAPGSEDDPLLFLLLAGETLVQPASTAAESAKKITCWITLREPIPERIVL
jgi:hypothetical protein